jgi:flagellar hook-length control protein FliK
MDSSSRIDTSTSFTLELRNRRQNLADDGQQDLFAQALGQQLAKDHYETTARYSLAKSRTSDRTDRAPSSPAPAGRPTSDPERADTAPANFVSRETLLGKKPILSGQNGTGKPAAAATKPMASAKVTASNGTATAKAATAAPDVTCASETALAAEDKATPVATGDEAEAVTPDADTGKAAAAATDPILPTPSTGPAQPTATAAAAPTAPAIPVAQATVLLLSGVPAAQEEDGTTADPIAADPQALAALLAKLQATQAAAAAPTTAGNATQQQNDPDATGGTEEAGQIGQAKPSEPAPADRVTAGVAKPKSKTSGQNAALRDPTDVIVKPATPEQASLTALAQTSTGTGRGITLPEGMSVNEDGDIGASDLEFSAWSEQFGPAFASGTARGANWQQSAFLAQLKQNVQIMQPHEQVAVQIQRAAQNGTGRLTVDLQPAELGRVEIKMSVDKDKNVTASVVVDRPATLDLLQRDARNLERILQDAGLQTDSGSLSFSLRNSGGDAQGQNQGGGTGKGNRGKTSGSDTAAAASSATRPTVVATADGYVDLET